MSFIEFLIDNFLWLIIMIVVIIVTLIGFIADSRLKNKKKAIVEKKEVNENNNVKDDVSDTNKVDIISNNQVLGENIPIVNSNVTNNLSSKPVENSENIKDEIKPIEQNTDSNNVQSNVEKSTIFSIDSIIASQQKSVKEEPGEFTMDLSNALNSSFTNNVNSSLNNSNIINNKSSSFITNNNEENIAMAEKIIKEEMWKL